MNLQIKKLTDTAIVPVKAHPTDSGFDLFADENILVEPGETVVISTGIAIALPEGYEAQIRPKSGVTSKTKLRIQLGTVDEPYRGEIGVIVDNISFVGNEDRGVNYIDGSPEKYISATYQILKGDKIAQMVIVKVEHPEVEVVEELNSTDRGQSGFGSTGVRNE